MAGEGPQPGTMEKLMEEVKLYWQVQLAVPVALGFLLTNVSLDPSKSSALPKDLALVSIMFLIAIVGSVYNLVGNFYAREAGAAATANPQENLVTPLIGICYVAVSGILGDAFLTAVMIDSRISTVSSSGTHWKWVLVAGAFLLGALLNWFICRTVFRKIQAIGDERYRNYAGALYLLYRVRRALRT